MNDETIHATTVAIDGRAVAIRGTSGAGKSDLALRMIDRGALLVADDRTVLRRAGATILASSPPTIAGRMEVRGVGIVARPTCSQARLGLLVDLGEEQRLPEPRHQDVLGVLVPVVTLDPRPASAAIKLELTLQLLKEGAA